MEPVDSRTRDLASNAAPYVTSDAHESIWGQPSISHYLLTIEGTSIRGHLLAGGYVVQSVAAPEIPASASDPEFEMELAAWEAASDADFAAFEEGLA